MATKTEQAQVNTQATRFGEFKPVTGSTGVMLHVLEKRSDHSTSMKLLDESGLMPFAREEMLSILVKDEKLKEFLKGKWFYLAGSGAKENGLYTLNEDGNLTSGKCQSIENTVRVWPGDKPLSLNVYFDYNAASHSWRFGLDAAFDPHDDAPVVVGKPKLSLSEQANVLLKKIESEAGNLKRSATQEDLAKRSNELATNAANLAKMLRPTEL